MKAGQVKNNEVWIRCLFCGDSQHSLTKAHLRIHLDSGLYFCHRCNEKGRVTPSLLARLNLLDLPSVDFLHQELIPELYRGPLTSRESLLPRWNTGQADAFKIYWLGQPEPVGYYLRGSQKKILGFTGFAWPENPKPILSDASAPLRLVEGPYDVKHPQDVCTFGLFNPKLIASQLKHHYFILSPDGDVWTSPSRKRAFFSALTSIIKSKLNLVGVEFHEANQDPDDRDAQTLIPLKYLQERIKANAASHIYI